jgi:hypothetical protein
MPKPAYDELISIRAYDGVFIDGPSVSHHAYIYRQSGQVAIVFRPGQQAQFSFQQ